MTTQIARKSRRKKIPQPLSSSAEVKDFDPFAPYRQDYRKWRWRIITSIILGYSSFYLVRLNFSMVIPSLIADFGYSKAALGTAITAFSIVYGIGKFLNGYLSDRSNARYFMAAGLAASGLLSILMGLSYGLMGFIVLYGLAGWFQAMGWPPSARMITHWFTSKELGTKWAYASSGHQIGGAVIVVLAGYLIPLYGWQSAFFIPGMIAISMALFLLNRLRDNPGDVGLPPVETYKGDVLEKASYDRISWKDIRGLILKNKYLWYVAFANMCLYIVRLGVLSWAPTFLQEMKGMDLTKVGWQIAAYDIIGIAGGVIAGRLSDQYFGGKRGPVGVLFMVLLSMALFYFWRIPADHYALNTLAMMIVGFLVYGPQILVGVASADFGSKRAVGIANGFASSFAYIGVALCGTPLGYLTDQWGWDAGFLFFIGAALLGAFFFALTRTRVRTDNTAQIEGNLPFNKQPGHLE